MSDDPKSCCAQAPVAYACFTDNGNIRLWSINHAEIEGWAKTVGRTVTALYAAASTTRLAELEAFVRQVANHEMSDNQNIRRAKELCGAAANERPQYFTECDYPKCECPRFGRCGNAVKDDMEGRAGK